VESIEGVLYGRTVIYNRLEDGEGEHKWAKIENDPRIELRHYTRFSKGKELMYAKVIGNITTDWEMLTLEWVNKNYPLATT
jgi:hypothetical protein